MELKYCYQSFIYEGCFIKYCFCHWAWLIGKFQEICVVSQIKRKKTRYYFKLMLVKWLIVDEWLLGHSDEFQFKYSCTDLFNKQCGWWFSCCIISFSFQSISFVLFPFSKLTGEWTYFFLIFLLLLNMSQFVLCAIYKYEKYSLISFLHFNLEHSYVILCFIFSTVNKIFSILVAFKLWLADLTDCSPQL